ncbi:MAG TPA: hypothetical protein VFC47_05930 [Caulobacteraceae bacterium]|nr:hypothetical protein [Caulobacteraceae bacterium]
MDEDKLGFLAEQSAGEVEEAASPETSQPEGARVEAAPEGPARGADGKFAARAAGQESGLEARAPVAPVEPGHVPLSALLDEREKRQASDRELAQMRARANPPPPPTRDEQLEAALYGQNLRASRRFAEREYGKESIATVHDWAARRCDEDPAFNTQMRSSEDPYEAAYQAYQREQVLAEVKPGELDAYRAWRAAQAQAATQTPQQPAKLPRSLATASGNGAAGSPDIPVGPGEAFASVIPR